MKIIFVLSIFLLSFQLQAQSKLRMLLTDTVKSTTELNEQLEVSFKRYAAIYILKKSHPKYNSIKKKLIQSDQNDSRISISFDGNSMEINQIIE